MNKLAALTMTGLLAVSIAAGGVACKSSKKNNNESATPTTISAGTPTMSAQTPSGTTTPGGLEAMTSTPESGTPATEVAATPTP